MSRQSREVVAFEDVHLTLTGGSGPVKVLRGVNLSVEAGETISVVGPSGSGKTTMLMVAAGLELPTSGHVRVTGRDLGGMDEDGLARFRRGRVSIVFQAFHLVPTMTALENVALPMEFAGQADAFKTARSALGSVGLEGRLNHYPGQLSGGEQQRVAIARAFVANPDILLADEPTGNLDEATGQMVTDLLFEMQQAHGTTMVLITHDPGLAGRAGRSVHMRDGRLYSPYGEPL